MARRRRRRQAQPFRFQPFSPRQLKLIHWWRDETPTAKHDIIIADGAIRSGKTIAMLVGFMTWSLTTFTGGTFIIAGRTIGALKRNVIEPLQKILTAWNLDFDYNRSENFIIVGSNIYYLFGASNEASQDVIQGLTAHGALADEVALMPRSFVVQMIARCSEDGSRVWLNCNPKGALHWFKVDYIDQSEDMNIYYLHFTMVDNLTLSARQKRRYKRQNTGVFYTRNILGKWVAASGRIFDMFQPSDAIPIVKQPCSEYYISVDYGTQNPMAFGLYGKLNGSWVKVKEYHYDGRKENRQKTDEEYHEDLINFAGHLNIRAVIVDPSAASFIAVVRRQGKFTVIKAKNAVLDGIRYLSSVLQSKQLQITEICEHTIKETETYVWDEKARERGEDKPLQENDHHMDEMRYFAYTILRREEVTAWN